MVPGASTLTLETGSRSSSTTAQNWPGSGTSAQADGSRGETGRTGRSEPTGGWRRGLGSGRPLGGSGGLGMGEMGLCLPRASLFPGPPAQRLVQGGAPRIAIG